MVYGLHIIQPCWIQNSVFTFFYLLSSNFYTIKYSRGSPRHTQKALSLSMFNQTNMSRHPTRSPERNQTNRNRHPLISVFFLNSFWFFGFLWGFRFLSFFSCEGRVWGRTGGQGHESWALVGGRVCGVDWGRGRGRVCGVGRISWV